MALLILALLQRIFLMSSLMLLLVWLIFFMVLIKLLPILGTISGKTDRKSGSAGMPRPISYAVFCLKKKKDRGTHGDPSSECRRFPRDKLAADGRGLALEVPHTYDH